MSILKAPDGQPFELVLLTKPQHAEEDVCKVLRFLANLSPCPHLAVEDHPAVFLGVVLGNLLHAWSLGFWGARVEGQGLRVYA